jgi:hypothetical protein
MNPPFKFCSQPKMNQKTQKVLGIPGDDPNTGYFFSAPMDWSDAFVLLFLPAFALSSPPLSSCYAASVVTLRNSIPGSGFSPVLGQRLALQRHTQPSGIPRLFIQCVYRSVIGGAIRSDGPLTIVLCHFEKCHAKSGAAATCTTDTVANFSTFEQITSESTNSIFDFWDNRESVCLTSNVFARILTGASSMFTKYEGDTTLDNCNFSDSVSKSYLPGFELGHGPFKVMFCIAQNFVSRESMGGIALCHSPKFSVSATLRNFSLMADSTRAAVAVWLEGKSQSGTFFQCSVTGCEAGNGKLILCPEGTQIIFRNCCFDVKKEDCWDVTALWIADEGNVFGSKDCKIVAPIGGIGYRAPPARRAKVRWDLRSVFMIWPLLAVAIVGMQLLSALRCKTL